MTANKNHIILGVLLFPIFMFGQVESIFNGITLNEPFDTVTNKLNSISETSKIITVDSPSFPMAKTKEDHLVCTNVKTENGTIEKVIFTFADDRLSYIEAKGNVAEVLTIKGKDTDMTYMDYDVFEKGRLFIKKKEDRAWILTDEALQLNLFTWENPYANDGYVAATITSNTIPDFVKVGGTLETLQPLFEANSSFTNTETLDDSDPYAQLQVNCFGVDYAGFPRKFEARFGNGQLNMVWILTGKGEEDRIRQALIAQFGKPIYVNDDWEIFDNWQVGLRKDKPEVLLMAQNIGLEYKESYFKQ